MNPLVAFTVTAVLGPWGFTVMTGAGVAVAAVTWAAAGVADRVRARRFTRRVQAYVDQTGGAR